MLNGGRVLTQINAIHVPRERGLEPMGASGIA
jgi:hypothetical protein